MLKLACSRTDVFVKFASTSASCCLGKVSRHIKSGTRTLPPPPDLHKVFTHKEGYEHIFPNFVLGRKTDWLTSMFFIVF
mgnify:CR=1 FL=1